MSLVVRNGKRGKNVAVADGRPRAEVAAHSIRSKGGFVGWSDAGLTLQRGIPKEGCHEGR